MIRAQLRLRSRCLRIRFGRMRVCFRSHRITPYSTQHVFDWCRTPSLCALATQRAMPLCDAVPNASNPQALSAARAFEYDVRRRVLVSIWL